MIKKRSTSFQETEKLHDDNDGVYLYKGASPALMTSVLKDAITDAKEYKEKTGKFAMHVWLPWIIGGIAVLLVIVIILFFGFYGRYKMNN